MRGPCYDILNDIVIQKKKQEDARNAGFWFKTYPFFPHRPKLIFVSEFRQLEKKSHQFEHSNSYKIINYANWDCYWVTTTTQAGIFGK